MTEPVARVACYLLVDRAGALLLQERDSDAPRHADKWTIPGGQVEAGESPEYAVHRELAEETDVVLGPGALRHWRTERRPGPHGASVDYHLFTAAVSLTDDEISCHEGRQIVFVQPDQFASLDLSDSSAWVLEGLLASERWVQLTSAHHFANILLVDPRGAVLLQERDSNPILDPDCWGLPGGHMEPGEAAVEAARRELEEETGVRLPRPPGHWADVPVFHAAYGTHDVVHTYVAATDLVDADIDCREGRQMAFVPQEDVAELRLTHSAAKILPAFLGSPVHRRLQEEACRH